MKKLKTHKAGQGSVTEEIILNYVLNRVYIKTWKILAFRKAVIQINQVFLLPSFTHKEIAFYCKLKHAT